MPLQKTAVPINFAQGLETKQDPFQVPVGKFLVLENSVFNKGGQLRKRNGYLKLTDLSDDSSLFATTFNGNLVAIGTRIQAYAAGSMTWVNKGNLLPVDLEVLPLIRSNTVQSQSDAVVSPNGLVCTVFTDNITSGSTTVASYKYAIADSTTGQNIVAPVAIPVASGTITNAPRVFLVGNHFVIVFTNLITATNHLQYVAINTTVPTIVTANTDISSTYTPATTLNFDGFVVNDTLYLAWNGSDGGGAIRINYLDSTLTLHGAVVYAGRVATHMSVTADSSGSTPVIYASFWDSASSTGYTLAFNQILAAVLSPTQWLATGTIANVTSTAISGVVTIYYENTNAYTYDSTVPTNFILYKTVTVAGTVGAATAVKRSVGLASKAFLVGSTSYFLGIYSSAFQPSYFLINRSGEIVGRLAYSNGGGYYTTGLPNVSITDTLAQMPYLIKDLIQAVNKDQTADSSAAVYSQTGVNLASWIVGFDEIGAAEIGGNLNITGGFMWGYDGYAPVESGFFVWPDVSASGVTILANPAPTATTTSGNPTLTAVSSVAGIVVGMNVTGAGIPANTKVISVGTTTVTMDKNASASATVTITFSGNLTAQQYFYAVTYEWSDNQGNIFRSAPSIPRTVTASAGNTSTVLNIPTLRLTYKTSNPVKLVIYRWSTAFQTYYQITSITVPVLNSTTVDSISYTDIQADSSIVGNSILYTTGGVVENIGPPATSQVTLYRSRLFLIDSEDRNLLWYSKQVIESTPVEMSDLFTIFVAPTTGAEGSTGPMTAISAMDDKLVIFKRDAIYYITGNGPDNTGANNDFSEPVFITSTVGCMNQASIVFIPQGLMFQSDKGIWLLGRDLSTNYIGAPVEGFNQYDVTGAVTIPGTNEVRFTLSNGATLMYDYFYGQWGTFVGVPAISSTLYQNLHTIINSLGEVFQENVGSYLDGAKPVLMKFTTSWLNFAGLQGFQRMYRFFLLGTYYSPHKLTVSIAYDYSPGASQQVIIAPDNYSLPYGGEQLWGSGNIYGGDPAKEQWGVDFNRQKCQALQVTIAESFDSSFGVDAGAGFTMSGLSFTVGLKDRSPRIKDANSIG